MLTSGCSENCRPRGSGSSGASLWLAAVAPTFQVGESRPSHAPAHSQTPPSQRLGDTAAS